ncbi:MAG TPA: carbon-nitrogen hydrolase family protein [Woeseiaceae bacterium]|nr:carbon-nitrogen hydrolase family protein [Woeseiaceae bacterium]
MVDTKDDVLNVGLAQIAPVWLDRAATLDRILQWTSKAADAGCRLVVFGEALLPGYPFWVERTDGARFDSALQKSLFAHYSAQAVNIGRGDLDPLSALAADRGIAVYLGVIERCPDRGHSVYCSMVFIGSDGRIGSVHRKLMPTYEERLVWSCGDGHGLRTHRIGAFTAGGLNCWENWLPLARAALYAQGEDLHVALWPGDRNSTEDITRFIAVEARSYVISVSGLMRAADIPDDLPHARELQAAAEEVMADGGSCVAAPDGSWLIEPMTGSEELRVAELDHRRVLEARHNMDPAGHYSRPDVTRLVVDRRRQVTARFED